jgi:hypothetical protein
VAVVPAPDYIQEAFGGIDLKKDKDAALKYALNVMVLDGRIEDLLNLMAPKARPHKFGGDRGWGIERRELTDLQGYEDWPKGATVCAFADPREVPIGHPEFFCDHAAFFKYAQQILLAYIKHLKQGV